jgi:tetratricopeptide (TPR) repeat protein
MTRAALVALVLFAGGKQKLTSVAVLPPATKSPAAQELAWLMQSKANAALAQTGKYADFHLKQVLGMAAEEGLPADALEGDELAAACARHLGAARVVHSRLEEAGGEWSLKITAVDPSSKKALTETIKLPKGAAAQVDEGGLALARAVAKLEGKNLTLKAGTVAPATTSDEAMTRYAKCHAIVSRQPVGIENPAVLAEDELKAAAAACQAALAADAAFDPARAALGLTYAILGDDKKAVDALAPLKGETYLPLYWVARFWLVTRYQSNDAGAAVLRDALAKYPGFLMARGYLGELLNVLDQQPAALEAWKAYLEVAPQSPFVTARVGKTLARMGKHDEAIAKTRAAVELDPLSTEMKVQLASRYIDAGKLTDAIATLDPLAKAGKVRPELLVRLAYAQLKSGAGAAAQPLLEDALARATAPSDWRTRGRAHYDLALLYARKKQDDQAQAHLDAAFSESYRPKELEPELKKVAIRAQVTKPVGDPISPPSLTPKLLPKETSPFTLDPTGGIDAKAAKPPPPQGFEILKFGK